jgi:hypothetical protein
MFVCTKWIPLVILPALFCDAIIVSAFINDSLDITPFKQILKSIPVGICFLEILILFVYTASSLASMIRLMMKMKSLR